MDSRRQQRGRFRRDVITLEMTSAANRNRLAASAQRLKRGGLRQLTLPSLLTSPLKPEPITKKGYSVVFFMLLLWFSLPPLSNGELWRNVSAWYSIQSWPRPVHLFCTIRASPRPHGSEQVHASPEPVQRQAAGLWLPRLQISRLPAARAHQPDRKTCVSIK